VAAWATWVSRWLQGAKATFGGAFALELLSNLPERCRHSQYRADPEKWRGNKMPDGALSYAAPCQPTHRNDGGALEIRIGTREFECIGLAPPDDHPHVYLNMGERENILCPYCATAYRFDPKLGHCEANPPACENVASSIRDTPEIGPCLLEPVGSA
jgi:uncharacterized Zn-finger protein